MPTAVLLGFAVVDSPSSKAGARVRSVRELIEWLDGYQSGSTAAVRAALDPDVRARLDAALPADYVTIVDDRHIVEAICRHVGPERARAVWRGYAGRLAESPLFRALFEGARRIAGSSPRMIARILPSGWSANYRDCGNCTGTLSGSESLIDFTDLHPVICSGPEYFWGWHGTLEGVQDVLGTKATIEADFRPKARMMHFTLRH